MLCSDFNAKYVNELEQCYDAVKELNVIDPRTTFRRSENTVEYPKGCYAYCGSCQIIYFNSHSLGMANEKARQICKTDNIHGKKNNALNLVFDSTN